MKRAAWHGVVVALSLVVGVASAQNETRGVQPRKTEDGAVVGGVIVGGAVEPVAFGHYHALLIAIDTYRDGATWPPLQTPQNDIRALRDVLVRGYGFEPARIRTLTNEQATRRGILLQLDEYVQSLDFDKESGRDNLLIYFAGHGQMHWDGAHREGFWIPWDADRDWPTWIAGSTLKRLIERIRAKILVVSDSCFSGDVFRSGPRGIPERTHKLYVAQSRQYLTAGRSELVRDSGPEGHSEFAYHALQFLRDPPGQHLLAVELHSHVFRAVRSAPVLAHIGDKTDGEFVFTVIDPDMAASARAAQAIEMTPGLPPGYLLPVNVEQVPMPVGDHPEFGRFVYRILDGPDAGTEMVLVPGGRFRPAPGHPEVEVEPFLIDRYEVTLERFETFMEANPDYPFPGLGNRTLIGDGVPIVKVSLDDSRAFAAWARKVVPTEEQWQFAALCSGGELRARAFAWGDEFVGQLPARLERVPVSVRDASRAKDQSFWGAVGMTGGVREWCLSQESRQLGVARGGRRVQAQRGERWSLDHLRLEPTVLDADRRHRWLGFRCVVPLRR